MIDTDPLKFLIVDRTPGCDNKYVFDPQTSDKRESWLRQINSLLNMQGDFLKGVLLLLTLVPLHLSPLHISSCRSKRLTRVSGQHTST